MVRDVPVGSYVFLLQMYTASAGNPPLYFLNLL